MPLMQRVGELRPSQMMYAFGVGAVVDLPYLSVMVMGLDDWPADPGLAPPISEERLLRAVRWTLGGQVQALLHPPAVPESDGMSGAFDEEARIGVPVASFPRWMVCPECRLLAPLERGLFELKKDAYHPERTRYVHPGCTRGKSPVAFPARFMVSCENGHLDEFPWHEYVHRGPSGCGGNLRLVEQGPSGEARDIFVQCDACGKRRALSEAFGRSGENSMPVCRGRKPHVRDFEECTLQAKAILLGASNLWFPEVLTTLAIPSGSTRLAQLVGEQWAVLQRIRSESDVDLLRSVVALASLAGYDDGQVWAAIQEHRARGEAGPEPQDLKSPE